MRRGAGVACHVEEGGSRSSVAHGAQGGRCSGASGEGAQARRGRGTSGAWCHTAGERRADMQTRGMVTVGPKWSAQLHISFFIYSNNFKLTRI
jgi:hypothetical protein